MSTTKTERWVRGLWCLLNQFIQYMLWCCYDLHFIIIRENRKTVFYWNNKTCRKFAAYGLLQVSFICTCLQESPPAKTANSVMHTLAGFTLKLLLKSWFVSWYMYSGGKVLGNDFNVTYFVWTVNKFTWSLYKNNRNITKSREIDTTK